MSPWTQVALRYALTGFEKKFRIQTRIPGSIRQRSLNRHALTLYELEIIMYDKVSQGNLDRTVCKHTSGACHRAIAPSGRVGTRADKLVLVFHAWLLPDVVEAHAIELFGIIPQLLACVDVVYVTADKCSRRKTWSDRELCRNSQKTIEGDFKSVSMCPLSLKSLHLRRLNGFALADSLITLSINRSSERCVLGNFPFTITSCSS